MRSYTAIGIYTFRKLMNRKRVIGLVLLTVLPALIIVLVGRRAGDPVAMVHGLAVGVLMAVVLPVIALVNATGALGDERRDHTLAYLTLKPVARWVLVAAALTGSVVATLLIGVVGVGALWLSGGWVTGTWSIGVAPLTGLAVIALGYGAVFVPVGFIFKRATLIGLVYVFFWEAILASAVTTLAASSLWRIGLSAYLAVLTEPPRDLVDQLGNVPPSVGGAFVKVGILVVLSVVATMWLLRTRDHVVGGGD
jgi:ABC-type transport system involved in multi-copper enzyme maturation permease subunit